MAGRSIDFLLWILEYQGIAGFDHIDLYQLLVRDFARKARVEVSASTIDLRNHSKYSGFGLL
jgi:hypothetical protein